MTKTEAKETKMGQERPERSMICLFKYAEVVMATIASTDTKPRGFASSVSPHWADIIVTSWPAELRCSHIMCESTRADTRKKTPTRKPRGRMHGTADCAAYAYEGILR